MKKVFISILAAVVISSPSAFAATTLQVEGSTTVGPIADAFNEYFSKEYSDIKITVKKTGSGSGATALLNGSCDIAMMSRFMKDKEFKSAVTAGVFPVAHVIAMDGISVIVHPSNRVSSLTSEQIADIYKGKYTNWKQLGGADLDIVVISRDTESGTYETFHNIVMKKESMANSVKHVSSNPHAYAVVSTTKGAIGYVGFGFVNNKVKALKVDGVAPTRDSIVSGQYPISRPLYMFTNKYPKLGSAAHKFISFYLTEDGQDIIEAKGFVPVTSY